MIRIIQAEKGKVEMLPKVQDGCWVQVIKPTPEDISFLESLGVLRDYIKYATDEEELSRIEAENEQTLIIVDLPTTANNARNKKTSTTPATFILMNGHFLISVANKENDLFDEILKSPILNTQNRIRTILQFLGKAALKYMQVLKEIDHIVNEIEQRAVRSVGKSEIIELMEVQKSLVYITSSLKADESMLDRFRLGSVVAIDKADLGYVEDIMIEIRQAREMADIHERLLTNAMDNYGSIISNNLNDIMKVLTVVTLLFSVPMVIFGLYGMNVGGLWFDESPYFAIGISVLFMIGLSIWFIKKKML
ncbi:MAG: magnesium transporter CorA family protein [Bacilli bacterium]|jgi:magnesium transporter